MSEFEKATELAKELETELSGWCITIEYEVGDSGAWQGVAWQKKSFTGDKIEEAREFARTHDCDGYIVYDPKGHVSEKVTSMFWRMVHEWDRLKKAV